MGLGRISGRLFLLPWLTGRSYRSARSTLTAWRDLTYGVKSARCTERGAAWVWVWRHGPSISSIQSWCLYPDSGGSMEVFRMLTISLRPGIKPAHQACASSVRIKPAQMRTRLGRPSTGSTAEHSHPRHGFGGARMAGVAPGPTVWVRVCRGGISHTQNRKAGSHDSQRSSF